MSVYRVLAAFHVEAGEESEATEQVEAWLLALDHSIEWVVYEGAEPVED